MSMPQGLQLGAAIHQAAHKPESHATFEGVYEGLPVIIKRGDTRLRREEGVLRAVNSDGIPKVAGYFEADGQDLLVMESIPGVPLSQYVELEDNWHSRRLSIRESIRIVDGLALCFNALHNAGYLYRDLDLAHVLVGTSRIGLVDHEWDVKLSEAGAGVVDSRAGTWETMAPEEFIVGNNMTPASNTYTLGVALLQLATGENPFFVAPEAFHTSESQREQAKELHELLPRIYTGSPSVDHILDRALQPEPSDRYQSIPEFREALILGQ
jgi:eukaryotic-like serine/threonine-protein kinase